MEARPTSSMKDETATENEAAATSSALTTNSLLMEGIWAGGLTVPESG
jgi:hypothetical protein